MIAIVGIIGMPCFCSMFNANIVISHVLRGFIVSAAADFVIT
jgi:hypothetical protein